MRDVTSEPELLGRPISLEASAAKGGRILSLAGAIDTRARRERDAAMELSAEN